VGTTVGTIGSEMGTTPSKTIGHNRRRVGVLGREIATGEATLQKSLYRPRLPFGSAVVTALGRPTQETWTRPRGPTATDRHQKPVSGSGT
jgi:hypothetical protein